MFTDGFTWMFLTKDKNGKITESQNYPSISLLRKGKRNWKIPFVMAIGDNDHRAINKGQMRYGVDFWNNKTPEDGSVKDVTLILNDLAPLLFEAKKC